MLHILICLRVKSPPVSGRPNISAASSLHLQTTFCFDFACTRPRWPPASPPPCPSMYVRSRYLLHTLLLSILLLLFLLYCAYLVKTRKNKYRQLVTRLRYRQTQARSIITTTNTPACALQKKSEGHIHMYVQKSNGRDSRGKNTNTPTNRVHTCHARVLRAGDHHI